MSGMRGSSGGDRILSMGAALCAVIIGLAACGAEEPSAPPGDAASNRSPIAQAPVAPDLLSPTPSDAARRDAQTVAKNLGITTEEALRRISLQDAIGELQAKLREEESDTFGSLWIEHQPEFRVVVTFTRDGEETIKPYIEGSPLADLVEVRTASVKESELRSIQMQATGLLRDLDPDLNVSSGTDVKRSVVEIYTTDKALVEATLRRAGAELPPHTEIVQVGEPAPTEPPPNVTPAPDVAMPRLKTRSVTAMAALLTGTLVEENGCLRVDSVGPDTDSRLLIWQPGFFATRNGDRIEIVDGEGKVVARVGEEVKLGGGESSPGSFVQEQIPPGCPGPYWLMGAGIQFNLKTDSPLFSIELYPYPFYGNHSAIFLRKKPALDSWITTKSSVSGKLTHYGRCMRLSDEGSPREYLPLWPEDHEIHADGAKVEVLNGAGEVVARVGEQVTLEGGEIGGGMDNPHFSQLVKDLPGGCNGPFWVISSTSQHGSR